MYRLVGSNMAKLVDSYLDLAESSREFGHKCFSISTFVSFILVILNTIVNVNNNLVSWHLIINKLV